VILLPSPHSSAPATQTRGDPDPNPHPRSTSIDQAMPLPDKHLRTRWLDPLIQLLTELPPPFP